jgi:hypothetical protein
VRQEVPASPGCQPPGADFRMPIIEATSAASTVLRHHRAIYSLPPSGRGRSATHVLSRSVGIVGILPKYLLYPSKSFRSRRNESGEITCAGNFVGNFLHYLIEASTREIVNQYNGIASTTEQDSGKAGDSEPAVGGSLRASTGRGALKSIRYRYRAKVNRALTWAATQAIVR